MAMKVWVEGKVVCLARVHGHVGPEEVGSVVQVVGLHVDRTPG